MPGGFGRGEGDSQSQAVPLSPLSFHFLSLGGTEQGKAGLLLFLPFCADTCNHELHQTPHPRVEAARHSERLSSKPELPSNSES